MNITSDAASLTSASIPLLKGKKQNFTTFEAPMALYMALFIYLFFIEVLNFQQHEVSTSVLSRLVTPCQPNGVGSAQCLCSTALVCHCGPDGGFSPQALSLLLVFNYSN